jgi:polyisoprenoid-binding protein YceI
MLVRHYRMDDRPWEKADMAPKSWQIDRARSDIAFTVRHMVISKVRGRFRSWDGTLLFDEGDPASAQVAIRIDAASIDTGDAARDAYLRSADFLNAEKHPHLAFKSTRVTPRGQNRYVLQGDLTIRDVTRPIAIDVEQRGQMLFSGKVSIERSDFGATWNQALEAGGWLVGKNVDIDIKFQAIAPAA